MKDRSQITIKISETLHPELYKFLANLSALKRGYYVQNVVNMELAERPKTSNSFAITVKTPGMEGTPIQRAIEIIVGTIDYFDRTQGNSQKGVPIGVKVSTSGQPLIPSGEKSLNVHQDDLVIKQTTHKAPKYPSN
jgi:hypothetical protein